MHDFVCKILTPAGGPDLATPMRFARSIGIAGELDFLRESGINSCEFASRIEASSRFAARVMMSCGSQAAAKPELGSHWALELGLLR